jgi:2-polyprenyl-3-methyl-5-hydroxy-6-metoxy-1,4-benzoquinol methylase
MNVHNASIEREGRSYDVYRCPQCGLGTTRPFPERQELERLYSSENYRAHKRRFVFPIEWFVRWSRNRRFKRVKKFSSRGRVLDIGCGRGLVLSMAESEGWEACGLEFSDESAAYARNELGLDVRTGNIKDAGFPDDDFDVVTIWHVLEHMEDPVGTIKECYRVLKPGGLLLISLPNMRSLQSVMTGRHWFHLDVPYHLYHFTTESLKQLLNSHSFKVMKVDHFSFEFNPFGYLQSLLNMSGIRYNLLYDILKAKGLRAGLRGNGYGGLLATLLLLPVYFPMAFVLSVFEYLVSMGGTIKVYARKEVT